MKIIQNAAVLTALLGQTASAEDCYALAMSGGGSKGAYEAGVLYGLLSEIPDKKTMAYDVVTGVSAGSINTAAVILFEKGDEEEMVKFLSDTWSSIVDKDVYKMWSEGLVKAVTQESGVFDDGPLSAYLLNIVKEKGPIKRKFMVSAVDVNSGTYVLFSEKNVTTYEEQVKAVVSSSSIPFVFPNQ